MSVYFILERRIFVIMENTKVFVIFACYFAWKMFVMMGNTSDV